jgi:hypothetical protein
VYSQVAHYDGKIPLSKLSERVSEFVSGSVHAPESRRLQTPSVVADRIVVGVDEFKIPRLSRGICAVRMAAKIRSAALPRSRRYHATTGGRGARSYPCDGPRILLRDDARALVRLGIECNFAIRLEVQHSFRPSRDRQLSRRAWFKKHLRSKVSEDSMARPQPKPATRCAIVVHNTTQASLAACATLFACVAAWLSLILAKKTPRIDGIMITHDIHEVRDDAVTRTAWFFRCHFERFIGATRRRRDCVALDLALIRAFPRLA